MTGNACPCTTRCGSRRRRLRRPQQAPDTRHPIATQTQGYSPPAAPYLSHDPRASHPAASTRALHWLDALAYEVHPKRLAPFRHDQYRRGCAPDSAAAWQATSPREQPPELGVSKSIKKEDRLVKAIRLRVLMGTHGWVLMVLVGFNPLPRMPIYSVLAPEDNRSGYSSYSSAIVDAVFQPRNRPFFRRLAYSHLLSSVQRQ